MNKVILMGRLTNDPEYRQTAGGTDLARFAIAVKRRFDKDGAADFISCTAWGKTAEFICRYFHKGEMIAVVGSIRTGSYQKNGEKVYTTEVNVDETYFTGERLAAGQAAPAAQVRHAVEQADPLDTLGDFPEVYDEELPF